MHSLRAAALAVVCAALVPACASDPVEEPPATVGTVPLPEEVGTLLPVEVNTLPPDDSVSLPPDALFGGDLCTSLAASDFRRVTFAGAGAGALVDSFPASEDSCQFTVEAGGDEYVVVVRARAAADLDAPAGTDAEVEALTGIGESAVGVDRGDRYEVIVKVANGYFSVTAPDATSATFLAVRAADRSLADGESGG